MKKNHVILWILWGHNFTETWFERRHWEADMDCMWKRQKEESMAKGNERRNEMGACGLALLYPNMPSTVRQWAEERRDIITSPPGPSPCISVSSSSLAATETNERVFPADHSHPLLPVPCDRLSELKRGNRSRHKRDSLAYPSGAQLYKSVHT